MEISAHIATNLHVAVVQWAAQHSTSVENVMATAITEYMADVDCGLLSEPPYECSSVLRMSTRQRDMAELFGKGAKRQP